MFHTLEKHISWCCLFTSEVERLLVLHRVGTSKKAPFMSSTGLSVTNEDLKGICSDMSVSSGRHGSLLSWEPTSGEGVDTCSYRKSRLQFLLMYHPPALSSVA